MRPSRVEVDLGAVGSNVAVVKDQVRPATFCAVVKADGYGHGDVPIAGAALAAGADWMAVALVEEGIRLREAGIDVPILLLSEPVVADADLVREWSLVPTVYRGALVDALGAGGTKPHPVHLKVDTGMHRVGAEPTAALALAGYIDRLPGVELQGVWTHLAVAEEDPGFTAVQLDRFDEFLGRLRAAGIDPPMVHAANTAAALGYRRARYTMVRIGLGLYGMRPAPTVAPDLELQPAMRVVSEVAYVRELPAGTRPSYGRRRELGPGARVATVPIGYADGIRRRLSAEGGAVLIRGKRYPFAGTVTMDQIVIDVGGDEIGVGDEVVLLGKQGAEEITAEEWAIRLDTINYEIVCGFGPRLPRHYRRGHA